MNLTFAQGIKLGLGLAFGVFLAQKTMELLGFFVYWLMVSNGFTGQ